MTEIAENVFSPPSSYLFKQSPNKLQSERSAMDPWQRKALAYGYHLPQHTDINLPDIHVHIARKITRLKLYSMEKGIISK